MENEAEHFNVSERDTTSRTSSKKSEKTASSTSSPSSPSSVTSEVASTIVSEILERSTGNLCELLQSISRWEAEDDRDKSSAARRVNQNIEHELDRFFGLRRLFAEYQGETLEDTHKDIVPEMDSAPGPSGQEGHETKTISTQTSRDSDRTDEKPTGSTIYEKVKSALKHYFKLEQKTADQNYGFPCPEEAFPSAHTPPSEDIRDATHDDLSSVPLQLVDHVEHEIVQKTVNTSSHPDEIAGLDSSESTSKENIQKRVCFQETDEPSQNKDVCQTALTVSAQKLCESDVTDVKSASRLESNIYKKISLKSCLESKPKKVQFATEKDLDEAVESGSTCPEKASPIASNEDIKSAEKTDLNSVPLEMNNNVGHEEVPPENKEVPFTFSPTGSSQPAEHGEVRFDVMDEDLVTITESTPGPSGQDLEPTRDHLAAEQSLDEMIETASSNLTSSSESPEEISITCSPGSSEDLQFAEEVDLSSVPMDLMDTAEKKDTPESVIDKLMEDELVTVMDATPTVPLVLLGAGYVDKVVQSASSELTSEDSSQTNSGSLFSGELSFVVIDAPSQEHEIYVCQTALKDSAQRFYKPDWTDVKSASTRESNIYKKMKSSLKSCFISKPKKKVWQATDEDLDEAVGSGSTCPYLTFELSNLTNSASPSSGESSFVEVDTLSQQIDKDICDPVQAVSTQEVSKSKDSTSLSPCPEKDRLPEHFQEDIVDAALPQLTDLKNIFYKTVKGFYDSVNEEQRMVLGEGVYDLNVNDKLASVCVEGLSLVIETITDTLSKSVNQYATPCGSLTSSQACANLFSETLRNKCVIIEDNLQQTLKSSSAEALSGFVDADMYLGITPKFTEGILRAISDEVNSETINAFLSGGPSNDQSDTCCKSSCCRLCKRRSAIVEVQSLFTQHKIVKTTKHSDARSKDDKSNDKVQENKLEWWICFRKMKEKKIHPVSDKQGDTEVRVSPNKLSSGHKLSSSPGASSDICSTPLELFDYEGEDEDDTSTDTGSNPSPNWIDFFLIDSMEDEEEDEEDEEDKEDEEEEEEEEEDGDEDEDDEDEDEDDEDEDEDENRERLLLLQTQTMKRSFFCPHSVASGSGKNDVMAARKRKDTFTWDQKASAWDQPVRTERPCLLRKMFGCCSLNE